jgi:hypothetical protein
MNFGRLIFAVLSLVLLSTAWGQGIPSPQVLEQPILTLEGLPDCQQLAIDGERNLFLLDLNQNRLYKYFALTNYDSAISLGGRGNREEGFLQAQKISVQNRQTLYLLDEGSQRILLFSINLRLLESLDLLTFSGQSAPSESLYPLSFDVSGIGEMFVLNQWDNKVYKFNAFGAFERSFGGLDFGEGSLYQADDLQVNAQNLVFVSDTSAQQFKVFDLFGQFRYTVQPPTPFRWQAFQLSGNYLLCWNASWLFVQNLNSQKDWLFPVKGLRSATLDREFLYLLQENRVTLHPLVGP